MSSQLNFSKIGQAMARLGLTNVKLAELLDVKPAAVTHWLQGTNNPRPDRLLRLAFALDLDFEELLAAAASPLPDPVVAYRRNAGKLTTEIEVEQAKDIGRLLRPVTDFLPHRLVKPAAFINPETTYKYFQAAASEVRERVGLGHTERVEYRHLIGTFNDLNAVIVPVMWGVREQHGNALHILLPESNATWIYLNLDSNATDFNFWMAHELGHVYTPELCGTDEGETFADGFAGALLFPEACAKPLYEKLKKKSDAVVVNSIKQSAKDYVLSPITVWSALNTYADANGDSNFGHLTSIYGAAKNVAKEFKTISQYLLQNSDECLPSVERYVEEAAKAFNTPVFKVFANYLLESAHGAGWLRDALNIPLADAKALYSHLSSHAEGDKLSEVVQN
jgi:transcriptional regulator with XRE-family HTH domain